MVSTKFYYDIRDTQEQFFTGVVAVLQQSYKTSILKKFAIFAGKYLCWSLFLINFVKRRLQHRCFPVNIAKFLRTAFLQNTSGGCFYSLRLFSSTILELFFKVQKLLLLLRSLIFQQKELQIHFKVTDIIKDQLTDKLIEWYIHNHFHNILRLSDILPNLLFTTS